MEASSDSYASFRPPPPTAPDEICSCPDGTAVKLMGRVGLSFNTIHCLECNLEVPPARLGLDRKLADAIAFWQYTYDAIDALELASGEYEGWAREQLLDVESPPNKDGLALARQLNLMTPTYFWLWQPESDDGWGPPSECPVCRGTLVAHESGIFPQLLCERDRVVIPGGGH